MQSTSPGSKGDSFVLSTNRHRRSVCGFVSESVMSPHDVERVAINPAASTQHIEKPLISSGLSPSPSPTRFSLQYAFFILGIGSLLPFNALLSVLDFYSLKFPSAPIAHYVSNAYTFPFMASGALLTIYPPPSRMRTPLVLFSYFLMTLISALYPLLSRFQSLSIPLILTALLGAINAMDQSVLFGILALLLANHPSCTTAYTTGGAVASLLLVSLRIVTRFVLDIDLAKSDLDVTPDSLRPGFILFFIVCTLLCGYCTAVVIWMYTKSEVYEAQVLAPEAAIHHFDSVSTAPLSFNNDETEFSATSQRSYFSLADMRLLFGKLRWDVLSMFFCFVLTLTLFPGITTELPVALRLSASSKTSSWYPLIIVGAFAIGDLLGRVSWSGTYATLYPDSLPYSSSGRIILIPFIVLLWTQSKGTSLIVAATAVFTIGLTNGFVMNAGFLIAPRRLNSLSEKEAAGRLMFLANNWGLFAGSSCGAILQLVMSKYTMFR